MIEKIIHFIWIGNNIPSNSKDTINSFKNMNPDFDINVIHITKDSNNDDYNDFINLLNIKDDIYYSYYNRYFKTEQEKYHKSEVAKNTFLSDVFRFYVLNKYGGFYLDFDTTPKKPFYDLLQYNVVLSTTIYESIKGFDIFFIGMCSNFFTTKFRHKKFDVEWKIIDLPIPDKFICDPVIRTNDTECIQNNQYINHYFKNDWVKS